MAKIQREPKDDTTSTELEKKKLCFVIMPIADREGYPEGHFRRVYDELIKPAVEDAGFTPERADDSSNTKVIILSILRSIVEYDMAICDLSSLNPNVLYELGVRQMAKKPVTLIKDEKTNRIFDIGLMSDIAYDSSLRVDLARSAKKRITESIISTYKERDSSSKSLLDLLSIQLQIETKTVPISNSEKIIIDQLNLLNRKFSQISEKQNPSSSQKHNDKWGVWDVYGDGLTEGSIVYGPSINSSLGGNNFFFVLLTIYVLPNPNSLNKLIFRVLLYNLYSQDNETITSEGFLPNYVKATEIDIAEKDPGQLESYHRFKSENP